MESGQKCPRCEKSFTKAKFIESQEDGLLICKRCDRKEEDEDKVYLKEYWPEFFQP